MKTVALLTALASTVALAQAAVETPPPPPPPPPSYVESPPPPPPPPPAVDAPKESAKGRVRWGLGAGLGTFIPATMVTFKAEGRVGYQVSQLFSAYAIAGGTAGLGLGVDTSIQGASFSLSATYHYYLGALAEVIFGDLFFVGAGPVLANGVWGGVGAKGTSNGVAEITSIFASGWMPALDLRLGLGFGKPKGTGRRSQFSLTLEGMVLFSPNSVYTRVRADGPNGTAGAEVKENGLAVGVVPTLMFGYDGR